MPRGSEAAKSKMAAAAGGTDRLSALPDRVLHLVLSFLPSSEAVATCLLARRWSHVWKSARGLRVNVSSYYNYGSAHHLNKFVNSLLLFRNASPVDVVEINSYKGRGSYEGDEDNEGEAFRYLELWIRYGLSWEARVLCVRNNTIGEDRWCLPLRLITSNHLTMLELDNVRLVASVLDFSSCPVLENLRMKDCDIDKTTRIMSASVKHLSMKSCCLDCGVRLKISVPNLIVLELADSWGCTPQLQSMPFLVSAFVRLMIDEDCAEMEDSACVLLGGLSNSTNLELTAPQDEPILRKDLTGCPVFGKLKTLLLNDWCMTDNLDALICFLQHSPVLEKLTLQFSETLEDLVEAGNTYDIEKGSFALGHLTVEIKCQNADDPRICRILNLLKDYGVPSVQIKFQQPPKLIKSNYHYPDSCASFSFEQEETSYAVDDAASSGSSDAASSDSSDAAFSDSPDD